MWVYDVNALRFLAVNQAAIDHYLAEAGETVALRFVHSLERAFDALARHPRAGSPRYAHELDIPGLRSRGLDGYPYLVFYVELPDQLDVWRVLHASRDIPAWMGPDGS